MPSWRHFLVLRTTSALFLLLGVALSGCPSVPVPESTQTASGAPTADYSAAPSAALTSSAAAVVAPPSPCPGHDLSLSLPIWLCRGQRCSGDQAELHIFRYPEGRPAAVRYDGEKSCYEAPTILFDWGGSKLLSSKDLPVGSKDIEQTIADRLPGIPLVEKLACGDVLSGKWQPNVLGKTPRTIASFIGKKRIRASYLIEGIVIQLKRCPPCIPHRKCNCVHGHAIVADTKVASEEANIRVIFRSPVLSSPARKPGLLKGKRYRLVVEPFTKIGRLSEPGDDFTLIAVVR